MITQNSKTHGEKHMETEKGLDIEKLKDFWVTEAEEALRVAAH